MIDLFCVECHFLTEHMNNTVSDLIICGRKDLLKQSIEKKLADLSSDDFKFGANIFQKTGMVIFVDDDGESRVLKNRNGKVPERKRNSSMDVEITITGGVGTAKTGFATLIRDYLLTVGLKDVVVEENPDIRGNPSKETAIAMLPYLREKIGRVTIKKQHKFTKLSFES